MKIDFLERPKKCPSYMVESHEGGLGLFDSWYNLKRGDKMPTMDEYQIIGFYRRRNNHVSVAFGTDLEMILGWGKITKEIATQA